MYNHIWKWTTKCHDFIPKGVKQATCMHENTMTSRVLSYIKALNFYNLNPTHNVLIILKGFYNLRKELYPTFKSFGYLFWFFYDLFRWAGCVYLWLV